MAWPPGLGGVNSQVSGPRQNQAEESGTDPWEKREPRERGLNVRAQAQVTGSGLALGP